MKNFLEESRRIHESRFGDSPIIEQSLFLSSKPIKSHIVFWLQLAGCYLCLDAIEAYLSGGYLEN